MTIYERIKNERIKLGLSQADLAKKVGYHGKSVISKVERGERNISQTMVVKYAKALNVSPTYLLVGEDDSISEKNKNVREFTELFNKLTEEQQNLIISQIKGILSNQ